MGARGEKEKEKKKREHRFHFKIVLNHKLDLIDFTDLSPGPTTNMKMLTEKNKHTMITSEL